MHSLLYAGHFLYFEKKNKSRLSRSPCCLCVCMSIPPIAAKQRLGKHVPAATNMRNNRRIFGSVVFCAVRVVWKVSRRLVLHRSSFKM
jgi:hypothetical protein